MSEVLRQFVIEMTQEEVQRLINLGGSEWVREQLAKVAHPFPSTNYEPRFKS